MTPDGLSYRLYVPADGRATHIRSGSAIVGESVHGGFDVHFEGGGAASNVVTFEDFVTHAAGRRSQHYPTTARAFMPSGSLVDVGAVTFDGTLRRWVVSEIDDAASLEAWHPGPHVVGGSEELRRKACGSLLSHFTSRGHVEFATARLGGGDQIRQIVEISRRPGRMR